MARRSKEALVIILDISTEGQQEGKLSKCAIQGRTIVELLLKQKLREQKKDEVCFIIAGSKAVAAQDDQEDDDILENDPTLACVHNFDVTSMEMYRRCLDTSFYQTSSVINTVDCIDAISTALSLLKRRTGKRKYTRKIWIISDCSGTKLEASDERTAVKETLEEDEVELKLIAVCGDDEAAFKAVQGVEEELDCTVESSTEAIAWLQGPQEPPTGATNKFSHGIMTIGSNEGEQVALRVQVFSKTDTTGNKLKTLTRLARSPSKGRPNAADYAPVEREHRHESSGKDAIGVEVSKEDIVSGFYYGKELIVIDQANAQALGYFPEPCLQILGFAKKSYVPVSNLISPVDLVLANNKAPQSVLGFDALVRAMKEEKQVALARYVGRKNATAAKLVRLTPSVGGALTAMYMVQVACAEEVRHYDFRSLEKYSPTKEQVGAMEALIDHFKVKDFTPENVSDPVYRRFYDEVHARAVDPSHTFAPVAKPPFEPSEALVKDGSEILNSIRKLFRLEAVQVQGKKRDYWSMEGGDSSAKEEQVKLEGDDTDLAGWLQKQKTKATSVGQANPVGDFESMLLDADSATAERAIQQLIARITAFVGPAGGEDYFEKATECTIALRLGCIQTKNSERFNTFLKKLKTERGSDADGFWKQQLLPKEISLITDKEAEDSLCSREEAKAFLQESAQTVEEDKEVEDKEEEASDMSDFD